MAASCKLYVTLRAVVTRANERCDPIRMRCDTTKCYTTVPTIKFFLITDGEAMKWIRRAMHRRLLKLKKGFRNLLLLLVGRTYAGALTWAKWSLCCGSRRS